MKERLKSFDAEPELLDRSDLSAQDTARALHDLARVNSLLLSQRPVRLTLLPRLLAAAQDSQRQVLVDLGTGLGDVPAALAHAAGRRGVELSVIGVDRKLSHLVLGRRKRRHSRVVAAAEALPFRSQSVDWCLSTLFFHHFDDATNHKILREMRRVVKQSAVVVDLRRSWGTLWLVRLVLPLIGVGRVARHDGVLSVRRSYTLLEVAGLVAEGPIAELRRRFPCRFSLVLPASLTGHPRQRR